MVSATHGGGDREALCLVKAEEDEDVLLQARKVSKHTQFARDRKWVINTRSITQKLTDSERTTETRLQRGNGTIVDGDVVAGRDDMCARDRA